AEDGIRDFHVTGVQTCALPILIIPPAGYWAEIQRICRQYDVLLVADEVICGFGRTGRWFGSERFGIAPDLMTVAKGLSSGYVPKIGRAACRVSADAAVAVQCDR